MASRVALVVVLGLAACGGQSEVSRPSQTTLTSGNLPAQESAQPRTVDSTGFVDNSGKTSDETEPTGTTGAGTAPERPLVPKSSALAPGAGGVSPIAGYDDVPGRLAGAVCDHEKVCERVGEGRPWPSHATCSSDMRSRAISDFDEMGCRLDASAVPVCLAEIRKAPCSSVIDRPASLAACARHSICGR